MFKAVAFASLAALASANVQDRAFYEAKFFDWLQEHKVQPKNGEDFLHMLANFANNHDMIEEHNAANLGYTLGHNAYSHMSHEEFVAYMRLGLGKPDSVYSDIRMEQVLDENVSLPASVDWRNSGAVTGVKDQGNCGSCWSFSATGALEGAQKIKYGTLISYSEQNLVSCDTKDSGCNGGLMDYAFDFCKKNGGLCTESGYPYTSGTSGQDGTCQTSCSKDSKVAVKSYTDVQTNSDTALMTAIAQQPVSVAIQANQPAFQFYKSGVLTGTCGTRLDHGVLAVGYGTESGLDYYLVKNSWGTSWGEAGYVKIQRNVEQRGGQCGILSGPPSYPTL